jgi:hypothetical protein
MHTERLDQNDEQGLQGIPWFGSAMPCQSTHGQTAIYAPAQVPPDALPAVKIQDNREIDLLMLKLDISDIKNPGLV